MTTEAVAKREQAPIAMGDNGIKLTTLEEAYRFATAVVKSGLAPKGLDTPEKVMIAVQSGMELGFSPMRALSAVVVVNGRPSLYGEAALALIHDRGVCSRPPIISVTGTGDERVAHCRFQRKDMPEPVDVTFSVAEAKTAKLWRKAGPWTDYEETMLGWRAVARASKLYFGDVTLGLVIAEEARDYPAEAAPRSLTPPTEPDPLLAEVIEEGPEMPAGATIGPEEADDPDLLASVLWAKLKAKNGGSEAKAEVALSELSVGKVNNFRTLPLYLREHPEFTKKAQEAIS